MAQSFTIVSTRLPAGDTPVCGVTLEPYVLIRKADTNSTVAADDSPEEGASDARYLLKSRWYRSVTSRGGAVCWIHPDNSAIIQCILCLRTKCDVRKSYHCSSECLKQHWHMHKEMHEQSRQNGGESNGYDYSFKNSTYSNGGESWVEVGKSRLYTPTADDVGSILKYECVALDTALPYQEVGKTFSVLTSRVKPAPLPPKRAMVALPGAKRNSQAPTFTLLTYNLLADLYATGDMFSRCQPHTMSWQYRKQNLLKELLNYKADILCLQEVQSNHFQDFLAPELQKHGYTAIYKKKTTEIYTGSSFSIDGCATFFKRDRFSLVKKYEVEFNKAAMSLSDAIAPDQKKAALNRLLKDNVALIAVLEALDPAHPETQGSGRRQLICVANTHIHANPELNDVKLWQVHTLLKGLEKIAASADIPMLVAGDFNSIPGSAAHSLLVKRMVEANHPELSNDPLGILRPASKLQHQLPLASACAALAAAPDSDPAIRKQKQRLDPKWQEPKFTNQTKDFKGTLDYILYTTDSLVPVGLLELPEEGEVKKPNGGVPNETWSSDHIALMAELQFKNH